ncbi:MAG: hypothetical protein K2X03_09030 [Bryobacteraceae bacterium]|nr:hypothetical protein [Bryobacteraceae bacterium]
MKYFFTAILVIHGLIHLMGTTKAFGFAEMPNLTQPISRAMGVLWLLAATLCLTTALMLFVSPKWWWMAVAAVAASQAVILSSWSDAKYGTVANLIVLLGAGFGYLSQSPASYRIQYAREVAPRLSPTPPARLLSESDLSHLPTSVQRYLRRSGAVGRPQVANFRARIHGRIRSGPEAQWMAFTGEQHNFFDPPARLFLIHASQYGLPAEVFHRFAGPSATMRVKVASLITLVDAKGPEMDEAETVTLFNDMCIFAPATLVLPGIAWRELDAHHVEASFTHESRTVQATLTFNDRDELIDFVSGNRWAAAADAKSFRQMRWSTPLSSYQAFGAHWLMRQGKGIWHAPEGDYVYLEIALDAVEFNVAGTPDQ